MYVYKLLIQVFAQGFEIRAKSRWEAIEVHGRAIGKDERNGNGTLNANGRVIDSSGLCSTTKIG